LATRRDLEELSELASLVERLPLVLAVDDAVLPFNVAHTDLHLLLDPRRTGAPQQRLRRLRPLASERADRVLWSRALAHDLDDPACAEAPVRFDGDLLMLSDTPLEPGLALTYVGHTPGPSLRLHCSRLFIDRGAVHADGNGSPWRLALLEHRRVARLLGKLLLHGWPGLQASHQQPPAAADIAGSAVNRPLHARTA
jgi:serine/threonine protein phosphatase 1